MFEQRVHREFHRHAAGIADSFPDAFRQFQVMPVTGRQVAAGLGDSDDRAAALQFPKGPPVILVALEIYSRLIRRIRIVEPVLAAKVWPL